MCCRILTAFLVSIYSVGSKPHPTHTGTIKNVSRYCQMSPGEGGHGGDGLNCPQLSSAAPDQLSPPSCHLGSQFQALSGVEEGRGHSRGRRTTGLQVTDDFKVLLHQIRTISPESKIPAVYPLSQTSCTIFHFFLRLEWEKFLEVLILGMGWALSQVWGRSWGLNPFRKFCPLMETTSQPSPARPMRGG